MDKNGEDTQIPKLVSNKLIYKGKFLSYFIKEFEIINGDQAIIKPYEAIDYNSRCFTQNEIPNEFIGKNNQNIYAVNIIPIIKYLSKPKKLIIVSVFRYPVNKFCLEFPDGFIDKTDINLTNEDFVESIKKAALRELEEETGFKGDFICFTSKMFLKNGCNKGDSSNIENELKLGSNIFFDPWKSSDNSIQCVVEIDGDKIYEKKQKLDEAELIKVYEVEFDKILEFINEKLKTGEYGCSSVLYYFALGLNFNNLFNSIIKK